MIDLKRYEFKLSIKPDYLISNEIKNVKYFQLFSYYHKDNGKKVSFIAITSKKHKQKNLKSREYLFEKIS